MTTNKTNPNTIYIIFIINPFPLLYENEPKMFQLNYAPLSKLFEKICLHYNIMTDMVNSYIENEYVNDLKLEVQIPDPMNHIKFQLDEEEKTHEDEYDIDELTRQQFAALRGAFELPRVAIIGPAGSGKTLLAIWKLSALLEEGRKAIFVCFNKALAESLKVQHPDLAGAIINVDSLFWRIVDDTSGSTGKDFFTNVLPERVMNAVYDLKGDDKYEAIIIDEGQDFGNERICALYELFEDTDDTQWLYFADNNQDLYGQGTDETLGAEVIFRLYHNCRNTEPVSYTHLTLPTNREV